MLYLILQPSILHLGRFQRLANWPRAYFPSFIAKATAILNNVTCHPVEPRPIISNSNGIFHGLSTWLEYHLQPFVRQPRTFLKDSDELC